MRHEAGGVAVVGCSKGRSHGRRKEAPLRPSYSHAQHYCAPCYFLENSEAREGCVLRGFVPHHHQQPPSWTSWEGSQLLLLLGRGNRGSASGELQHCLLLLLQENCLRRMDRRRHYFPSAVKGQRAEVLRMLMRCWVTAFLPSRGVTAARSGPRWRPFERWSWKRRPVR